MGKPDFNTLFEASSLEMYLVFLRSKSGGRPDEIGLPREHQVKVFLEEWLPSKYGLSKGYIISLSKDVSKECDIVVYDKDNCPKFVYDKTIGIQFFPKSEVFGTFEVKSTLSKNELKNSLKKISSVKEILSGTADDVITHENWEKEKNIALAEFTSSSIIPHISDEEYKEYILKFKKESIEYSEAFCGIFAYTIGTNYSIEELKEKLQEAIHPPEIVVILDKGILIKKSDFTINRYHSLIKNVANSDVKNSIDVRRGRIESKIRKSTDYILLENTDQGINLMYFYIFLLDYLKEFKKYPSSNASDLISVWKNHQ